MTDWDPARYAAFRALRLRQALDLLAPVGDLPDGRAFFPFSHVILILERS